MHRAFVAIGTIVFSVVATIGLSASSAFAAPDGCQGFLFDSTLGSDCSTPGSGNPGVGSEDGYGTSSASDDQPAPECHSVSGKVIPCSSDAGAWNGSCYLKALDPPPPFDDPRWNGRTDGAIVSCIVIPGDAPYFDGADAPPYFSYWAPAAEAVDPSELARRALASLTLPGAPINMTPQPNLVEPNILIHRDNHVWVPTASLAPMTASASDGGLTVTLTAAPTAVTFTSKDGDGVATTTCDPTLIDGPPYDPTGIPVCSLVWEHVSLDEPDGQYTITASTTWTAEWTGGGQSGTLTTTTSSTAQVAVRDWPVRIVHNS